MRQAEILINGIPAGILTEESRHRYVFKYLDSYLSSSYPPVSLTLPKREEEYVSDGLFPYFCNILPEGENLRALCRSHRIDPDDFFSQLLAFSGKDFIGAIGVRAL